MTTDTHSCWIIKVEDWDGSMIIGINTTVEGAITVAESYLSSDPKPTISITIEEFIIDMPYSTGIRKSYIFGTGGEKDEKFKHLDSRISVTSNVPTKV
jgi:hypothetical protein